MEGIEGVDIPRQFVCPITLTLMRDPVVAKDSLSYEGAAIEQWFRANDTSPVTREHLEDKSVVKNTALRTQICEFLEKLKQDKQDHHKQDIEKQQKLQSMAIEMFSMRDQDLLKRLREVRDFVEREGYVVLGQVLFERIELLIANLAPSETLALDALKNELEELHLQHSIRLSGLASKLAQIRSCKEAALELQQELQENLAEAPCTHAEVELVLRDYSQYIETREMDIGGAHLQPHFGPDFLAEAQEYLETQKTRGVIMLRAAVAAGNVAAMYHLARLTDDDLLFAQANEATGDLKEGDTGRGIKVMVHGTAVGPRYFMYEGEFVNGQHHGEGIKTYSNGDIYKGEWEDGLRHGRGTITWSSGASYDGQWKKDKRCGEGIKTYSNGDIYKGEWQDGRRHGKGIITWSIGGATYDGQWKDDRRCGEGIYTKDNGDTYKGQFKDGEKHGQGIQTCSLLGTTYEGQWRHGKRDGEGILTFQDGDTFKAQWTCGESRRRGPSQLRDKFKSNIFTVTEKKKLPHSLKLAFGEDAVASVQLQSKLRVDGRCFDELFAIAQFVLSRVKGVEEMEECMRGVREDLPSLLRRRQLLQGEEEETRYAATLHHNDGKPRYLEWIEIQAYLDEAGFDATLLNNVQRGRGSYVYMAQPSAYNQGNRPHLLLTLQSDHWQLLLKREMHPNAAETHIQQFLCLWRHCDLVAAMEHFQPMPPPCAAREAMQSLLPMWEDEKAKPQPDPEDDAQHTRGKSKRKAAATTHITPKKSQKVTKKKPMPAHDTGFIPPIHFTPERENGEWPQVTLERSQRLETVARVEQVNLDQLVEWNVAQLPGLTKRSTLKRGTSLLLPREFTPQESAALAKE